VIVGLAFVVFGEWIGMADMFRTADALAALGVAGIVVALSVRLSRESIDILIDRAPEGLREEIRRAALEVPGVLEVPRVRVRRSGGDQFADLVIVTHGATPVAGAHQIADKVEEHLRAAFPRSDLVVHVEPAHSWDDPASAVRGLAARRGLTIHDLTVHDGPADVVVDLHVEVPPGIRLEEAHRLVLPLEDDIRGEVPRIGRVNIHLDPLDAGMIAGNDDAEALGMIRPFLEETIASLPEIRTYHDLLVRRDGRRLYVSVHTVFDGAAPIDAVHRAAESLEARLRRRFPEILRVLVHTEPQIVTR